MFENLSLKFDQAFKTLKGTNKLTELNVAATIKEIRRALIDADVNYKVAKDFTDRVREEAMGQNILINVEPGQLMTKIVYDELTALMGGKASDLKIAPKGPTVYLIAGLQGSGKTTFSGKLANLLKSKGRNVLLVAGDVYRPAAMDQLKVLGDQIGVAVHIERENKDPVSIAENGIAYAKEHGKDIIIVDTAGRLAVDEQMMNEIALVKKAIQPTETLFVVDSMTGQDAVNTAKAFNDRLGFDGVVLTKLDGDTRGGAAISIRTVVDKPIKFVGTGEKLEALDIFHPDRMASRILGFGDVVSLVERAQQQFDQDEAMRLQKKLRKNEFDFDDFLTQIQAIKKMGNLKDLISMIPGVGKQIKDLDISDDAFKHVEAIIRSMTKEERSKPLVINGPRRKRIATGSGRTVREVNELLVQFDQMRDMMKKMNAMSGGGGGRAALQAMQQRQQQQQRKR